MFLIVLTIFLVYLAFILYQKMRFWSKRGVIDQEFVDYKGLRGAHHQYALDMSRKHGRIYGGFMLTKMFIVINEPELIKEMYVKHFHELPNHTHFNVGTTPKVSSMLFFMPGDDNWKRIRSIMTPAFTLGKLKAMMSSITDISERLIKSLDVYAVSGEVFDMRRYIGAFAMDVVCSCVYGISIDSINDQDHPIIINVKKLLNKNATLTMMVCVIFPELAKLLGINFFDMSAIDFFDKLIAQIKEERKKLYRDDHVKRKTDFIQIMLDSEEMDVDFDTLIGEDKDIISEQIGRKQMATLSSDELTAQAIVFFVAGYDTTSSAISHLIYYLSQNKKCQQKLYEELKEVKEFSYENLSQFKYLNAVINETLRLAPPVNHIQRQSDQDFEISGIKIPAGTSIEVLPYALHRDPEFWTDPLEFKPERFLNPTHHPWAYIPFGGGPRICIGKRFSLNEIRICAAKLFSKFEFDISLEYKLDYYNPNIILALKSLMCTIKHRN